MSTKRLVAKLFMLWIAAFLALGSGYRLADDLKKSVHVDDGYWLACKWVPRDDEKHALLKAPLFEAWLRFEGWAVLGLCSVVYELWASLNIQEFLGWLFEQAGRRTSNSEVRKKTTVT